MSRIVQVAFFLCKLITSLIVGRLHVSVYFLIFMLQKRGVHWYGSPDLPMGRLLCAIRRHLGPLSRLA